MILCLSKLSVYPTAPLFHVLRVCELENRSKLSSQYPKKSRVMLLLSFSPLQLHILHMKLKLNKARFLKISCGNSHAVSIPTPNPKHCVKKRGEGISLLVTDHLNHHLESQNIIARKDLGGHLIIISIQKFR